MSDGERDRREFRPIPQNQRKSGKRKKKWNALGQLLLLLHLTNASVKSCPAAACTTSSLCEVK